jgi:mRNA-degrading endonuclease toxin of MazEF toxin-antitoxin module
MMRRGDVVIVAFPYVAGGAGKNRPALVVQSDRDNQRLSNTIVAMITGNTRYAQADPTQLLIDPSTRDGQLSGLNYPSAVKCGNLYTIDQRDIIATIGSLPPSLMGLVATCLKAALELP